MTQLMAECTSAASVPFNPDCRFVQVNCEDDGHRLVVITTPTVEDSYSECGV